MTKDVGTETRQVDADIKNQAEPARDPTVRTKRQVRKPGLAGMIIAAIAYYLLAKFGISLFALKPDNITLLWLPSGIALFMCLQWRAWALPLIFIASFAANIDGLGGITASSAVKHTLISAFVDSLAGILAASLFRRYLPKGLSDTRDLPAFILAVCLVTTTITSTLLTANLVYGHYIPPSDAFSFARMLILADSLGILLVYPVYQGWLYGIDLSGLHKRWFVGGIFALALIFFAIWAGMPFVLYFILPVLLLVSFNSDMFGIGLLTAIGMTLVAAFTAQGLGPLATDIPVETNSRLVAFSFAGALTILGMALQHRQLLISELLTQSWQDAAKTDPLTGVFNRRALFSLAERELQSSRGDGSGQYSVALLDLDHFKQVNDKYGHVAGDAVLVRFATLLKDHCRDIDVPARVGGEEFAVFLPRCSLKDATQAMNRVCTTFSRSPTLINGQEIMVTVSIGVAAPSTARQNKTSKTEDLNMVMARADKALYSAKAQGRNQVATT